MTNTTSTLRAIRLEPHGPLMDVFIQKGRFEKILPHEPQKEKPKTQGLLLIPGAIDPHVHFRTPGGEHKESIESGALAALSGGVTHCMDMPNTQPPTRTKALLEEKKTRAKNTKLRFSFHVGINPERPQDFLDMLPDSSIGAVKLYLANSTNSDGTSNENAEKVFKLTAENNIPLIVHAEDECRIQERQPKFPPSVHAHHSIRDLQSEKNAVQLALELGHTYGTKLYLAHLTSLSLIELAEKAKLRPKAFCEVCPHHLVLDTESIQPPNEGFYKVNPPLRTPQERQQLFSGLKKGIDCLGSDHAPHTLEEKNWPYPKTPSGLPGVEYILPFALTFWLKGDISFSRMLELTSGNAAKFFGLEEGEIAEGKLADCVLVDPEKAWVIGERPHKSLCGWSPYDGMRMLGEIQWTMVGGEIVHRKEDL